MSLASLEEPSKRNEIRTRMTGFDPQAERRWGTLTPGGAVCHLAYAYEMVIDGSPCSERTGALQRTALRWVALHTPLRWPRGVPTLPELVEGAPGVRPQEFAGDRTRLLSALDRFIATPATGDGSIAGRSHPIFGPLTYWEWMRWGYLHADHHLRQFGL
jgi:hypothetical protein